jgi:hypothetical protein
MHLHDFAIMLAVGALLLGVLEGIKWVVARGQ